VRRLAYFLGIIAIAAMILLVLRLNGTTAIIFSFIGMPSLALALALYGYGRWRAGAFRLNAPPE
jgi:hypothetical protein